MITPMHTDLMFIKPKMVRDLTGIEVVAIMPTIYVAKILYKIISTLSHNECPSVRPFDEHYN